MLADGRQRLEAWTAPLREKILHGLCEGLYYGSSLAVRLHTEKIVAYPLQVAGVFSKPPCDGSIVHGRRPLVSHGYYTNVHYRNEGSLVSCKKRASDPFSQKELLAVSQQRSAIELGNERCTLAELVLEGLTKRFAGGVTAVRGLSLAVADGELVVLVGPSGCGKTTILRMISGLETPDAGTIRMNGQSVNHLAPGRRDVAFVFQRPALYPHLNVRQNLEFGFRARRQSYPWIDWIFPVVPRLRKTDEAELGSRVAETAALLRVDHLLDRRPNQLSGGEQQRVALGRALVRRPVAYLLDEPMANLDSHLRAEMRRELHLLHRHLRATMIYVTHDQTEAMTLADRLVVLNRGEALQTGRPLDVYERPNDRFVAGFLGWPPMNFLSGRVVTDEAAGLWLNSGDCRLPLEGAVPWIKGLQGRQVTLGVRPTDVRFTSPGGPLAGLTMEVAAIERLGGRSLVSAVRASWRLSAWRDGACSLRECDTVAAELDTRRLHWFDSASGRAIGPDAVAS
jgi:multiple sugar transport system ATP-binding protein